MASCMERKEMESEAHFAPNYWKELEKVKGL